jgi:hypothetical protein
MSKSPFDHGLGKFSSLTLPKSVDGASVDGAGALIRRMSDERTVAPLFADGIETEAVVKIFQNLTLLIVASGLALSTPSLAAPQGNCAPAAQPQILISATELGSSQAANCQRSFQVAQERGPVCRNGARTCTGMGPGRIGYSCCGCGFCGWWSAN